MVCARKVTVVQERREQRYAATSDRCVRVTRPPRPGNRWPRVAAADGGSAVLRACASSDVRSGATRGLRQAFGSGPTTITNTASFASGTPGHAGFSAFFSS